ncbi:hypothetical protein bcCo53_000222 [Borrelia coriaceae]|nr:hypothetical protein [Borrelia coriaceae]UPA16096.1 hypothetical protein bcCo53_000222 [Borrelia coriaceae]
MVKSSPAQKIFILASLLVIFMGCTKKPKKISFNDTETLYNAKDEIVIQSILAEEGNESFEYHIRIPKIIDSRTKNNNIKTFNDEVESYTNEIINNLESAAQNIKQESKKPSLKIDYEIYHGYGIYTIIVSATQVINNTSIINHRSYYIKDNGDYIYNIDEILKVEEAFPYFTQRIKEEIDKMYPNNLLFDLQQAVVYFENKKIIVKFPLYVFNLDDTENTQNIFEFSEEEAIKYIKRIK